MKDKTGGYSPFSRPQAAAFTLVELLIVIGIIALLIAILIPSLGLAKRSARLVECEGNLRQIAGAANVYALQYDGWTPRDAFSVSDAFFAEHYAPMLGAPPPDMRVVTVGGMTGPRVQVDIAYCDQWLRNVKAFRCPGLLDQDRSLDYAVNAMDFGHYASQHLYAERSWQRMSNVPNPSRVAHIVEVNATTLSATSLSEFNIYKPTDLPYITPPLPKAGQPSASPTMIAAHDQRHGGRTVVLYFDGHVEAHDISQPGDVGLSILNPYAP